MNHEVFMARAIQLAERGRYTTTPNPRVGCVLVKDGQIVGEGFHARAGEGHAEVNALAQAGAHAQGATAYVTLEPCSHQGRTPPCADGLIQAGIKTVVCGMEDPNPQVAGRGFGKLRAAGIEVTSGILQSQARALNPGFIKRMEKQLPWVRVKIAQSQDGRTAMANGESQWITGPEARADVQKWRAQSCAMVTGAGTVLADDPALTVRPKQLGEDIGRQPKRVLMDRQLRIPQTAQVFNADAPVLWAHSADAQPLALPEHVRSLSFVDLGDLLAQLAADDVNEVLVEAGPTLAGAFLASGWVDELILYTAPKLLGSRGRPMAELPLDHMDQAIQLDLVDQRLIGADTRSLFRLN